MMRQYELVERVTAYKRNADEALLNKAYVYAMQKHGHQRRANGDPYFSHPLEVAAILTELRMDEETIAVALLHDTIEDTDATRKEIDGLFGEGIGELVDGLTKLQRFELVSKKAQQAENLRRLLLAVSKDIRVLLVKLADRLHNMRTLGAMPEDKRRRIAEETMEIYAPLAGRIGMQKMREELEDLAFRHLNPKAYEIVSARLEAAEAESGDVVGRVTAELKGKLEAEGIAATVRSRRKKPYSVYGKMQRKAIGFSQLSDIYGFRIIVDTVEACYRTLGIVHTTWNTVPDRFKDYISTPKRNEYRSLHTTVRGPLKERVELQIRTWDMHTVAEFGVAAHSQYKDGTKANGAAPAGANGSAAAGGASAASGPDAFQRLRQTIAQLADGTHRPEDFLENTKLELFVDQVFCFTPKGDIIALPKGATPIDFAYAVHTELGHSCGGVRINGQSMPLYTELQNGDEVDIVRSSLRKPMPGWEKEVVTGKARAAIRRATRDMKQREFLGIGTRMLERAFTEAGKRFSTDLLRGALGKLGREGVEEVLADVGSGELARRDVLRAVFPDYKERRAAPAHPPREEGWFNVKSGANLLFRLPETLGLSRGGDTALPLKGGADALQVRFAPESGAVPGDRIVGIVTPGEGITVYPIQAPALKGFERGENWIDMRWDVEERSTLRYPARIRVTAENTPGTLAAIAQVMADHDANIQHLELRRTLPDFMEMVFGIDVWDLGHLNRIISEMKTRSMVSAAERVFE